MRAIAGLFALIRVAVGAAFVADPKRAGRTWIGRQADVPGTQVISQAFGARDAALGLGTLQAVIRNDGSARPWLVGQVISDSVDFAATYAAGRRIPRKARTAVMAIAAGSALAGVVLAAGIKDPGNTEPPELSHDLPEAGAMPTEAVAGA